MYEEDGSDINLAVCMSWYQDIKGVKRAYESCKMDDPYAPQHFIAVDGVYTFFRFKDRPTPDLSDDGSREWLKEQNKVTIVNYPGYQVDKRMKYVNKAAEMGCDAIIILDSDEYIMPEYSDWKEFRKWLTRYARGHDPYHYGFVFNLMFWVDSQYEKAYNTIDTEEFTFMPRVWHAPQNLEYYNGVHYWVRRRDTDDVAERLGSTTITIDHGIRLAQDSKLRDKQLLDARNKWARSGIKHEDGLIKRYNTINNLPYNSVYKMVFGDDSHPVTNVITPLVAITVNFYISEVLYDLKKIINVDKIYLDGFADQALALNKARAFFLAHQEYSHLIITSDLLKVQRADINKIISRLHKHAIVSGYSKRPNCEATFCKDEVHFLSTERKFNRVDLKDLKNCTLNEFGLIDVKYTDLYLIGINRKVLEKNSFEKYNEDIK